jgi:hypothetical protein
MSKWIPLSERLPDIGQPCLCAKYLGNNEWWYGCAEYQEYGFPFASFQNNEKNAGITHWKPIYRPEEAND